MATERFTFPANFLWGTATAAHQVEGNNINCDYWVLEHTPGSPFVEPSGRRVRPVPSLCRRYCDARAARLQRLPLLD